MGVPDVLNRKEVYDRIERMLEEAGPLVDKFRGKYNVHLMAVGVTDERGSFEPYFVFDDGQGHYTIDGIRDSLE